MHCSLSWPSKPIKVSSYRIRRNCSIASFVDILIKRFCNENPQIQTNFHFFNLIFFFFYKKKGERGRGVFYLSTTTCIYCTIQHKHLSFLSVTFLSFEMILIQVLLFFNNVEIFIPIICSWFKFFFRIFSPYCSHILVFFSYFSDTIWSYLKLLKVLHWKIFKLVNM